MSKVILICGKICSGKTTYADALKTKYNAVNLSSDELISDLFHPNENDYHDKIIKNIHSYLIKKSIELVNIGTTLILDWGFWTKKDRDTISKIYRDNGISFEWHYIDISDAMWYKNIEKRNKLVLEGKSTDYYVDEGLLDKVNSLFEVPNKSDIDVWYELK